MPDMNLGNGYSIDLNDGWTFVHTLEDALKQLNQEWAQHAQALQAPPPGRDAHSARFSQVMTQAIQAHNDWATQQQKKLGEMITSARAMLKQYGIAETENTVKWADDTGSAPPWQQHGGPRAV